MTVTGRAGDARRRRLRPDGREWARHGRRRRCLDRERVEDRLVGGRSARVAVQAGATGYARVGDVSKSGHGRQAHGVDRVRPTGGGAYLSTIVRGTAAGDYSAVVKILAGGAVTVNLRSTAATIGSTVTVPGITYTAGTKLAVRVQATGSAPTTLR